MKLNLKWVNKFKRPPKTTWSHSSWHQGPKKPKVWIVKDPEDGQWVKLWDGTFGVCVGPWINDYKWDGSYYIIGLDYTVHFLYPSKFSWTGKTLREEKELRKILKEKRERKSSLERHYDG